MAILVALEGIDGTGKGTQAQRLVERIRSTGLRVELLSFPRYEATRFGQAIGDFLNGRFGTLDQVHPFLAAVLYAGDRFESRGLLDKACAEADIVVFDRFVASNLAHQGSRLPLDQREDFVQRMQAIEHEVFGLPKTDLTILLELPADEAQKLVAKKEARTYTEREADIQEADTSYLNGVSAVYQSLAEADADWRIVKCLRDGDLRTIESISDEVWQHVRPLLP
jgi:dTMP kinase